MLRMTAVEACAPELPPVPMSMGIKPMSTACTASASSKEFIIRLVNVAESMRNISHGTRRFHISKALVLEYGLSEGVIAAISSKSSVASASITSMTSSTVTMPTRRPSLSTTGSAMRS